MRSWTIWSASPAMPWRQLTRSAFARPPTGSPNFPELVVRRRILVPWLVSSASSLTVRLDADDTSQGTKMRLRTTNSGKFGEPVGGLANALRVSCRHGIAGDADQIVHDRIQVCLRRTCNADDSHQ